MNRTTSTHDEINVMGPAPKLKALIAKFNADVSERFKADDLNIVVKREQCDEVTDWCDANAVAWRLL